jgi:trans-aconitate methyltransferase
MSDFDRYAEGYVDALAKGLSYTGENWDYFARGRVALLRERLSARQTHITTAMDFGCGEGSTLALLRDACGASHLYGVEAAGEFVRRASELHAHPQHSFVSVDQWPDTQAVDLVYCNGVFHHILPAQRPATLRFIRRALRPGGVFALFENNPWNPGTRWVMSRIPFDADAHVLSARRSWTMLETAGFRPVGLDFLFVFPRALSAFRPLEQRLRRFPLGAQYLVLAER